MSAIRVQHEEQESDARLLRKRSVSFAKHKRMSLWASTSQDTGPLQPKKSMFCAKKSLGPIEECKRLSLHPNNQFPRHSVVTEQLETMELDLMEHFLIMGFPVIYMEMHREGLMCR